MTANKKLIRIGDKLIGNNQPVFIIAEAGVNHNGRLDLALKLIDAAAEAGADAVKFQTFRAEQVATASVKMADYQKRNIGRAGSQLAMLKKLELKEKYYPALIKRAKERKIIFLSTPHGGFESADFLQKLKIPAFKFGSGELTNLPLLGYAAKFGRPIIIGTGMATMEEIKSAVKAIKSAGNNKIIALHCTTNYPCPLNEVNLRAMQSIKKELGVLTGYSDHTLGSQVSVMAATLGACVLEKHLTLSKKMAGPDHKASVEPEELKEMVAQVRNSEIILGSPQKKPVKSEIKIKPIARKSIVAGVDIKRGQKITKEMIAIKKPGTGISPGYLGRIIGRSAGADIRKDTIIKWEMIK